MKQISAERTINLHFNKLNNTHLIKAWNTKYFDSGNKAKTLLLLNIC